MNDVRRQKNYRNMHFGFKESRQKPRKRSYDEYIASGKTAIETKSPCNGVKGIWKFHILPYACDIAWTVDAMHAHNNVVCDMLSSIRPTNGGDKQLFKHKNRTTHDKVLNACQAEGIPTSTHHVLSKADCIRADSVMKKVLGQYSSGEVPRGVMKKGSGRNSHDTILWATTWAPWCLRHKLDDDNCVSYFENILDVFDIMGMLNSSSLKVDKFNEDFMLMLLDAVILRSGLMPPTECTMTLHELIHTCDQVLEQGVNRVSTLYKFERVNHFLKTLLQNSAAGTITLLDNFRYY